ncbi:MAG: hypothetical protein ACLQA5_09705, partial [Solirubrobacteraceae bacterium]
MQVRDHHLARTIEAEFGVRGDVPAEDRVGEGEDRVVARRRLVLASKAGVDPERLIEVLSGGLAGNKVM